MRVDKAKKIEKVTEELLKNPLQSVREVANKTWVSKSSVASYINEDLDKLGQKDEKIISITDTDREIILKAQIIVLDSLDKHIEISQASGWLSLQEALQASNLAKESTARYTIFRGSATDDKGWLNDIWSILWMIQGMNK